MSETKRIKEDAEAMEAIQTLRARGYSSAAVYEVMKLLVAGERFKPIQCRRKRVKPESEVKG